MFQPVIPVSGLGGWRFLQQTYDKQFESFTKSVEIRRDSDYFREKISSITTADELVSDRRLLKVALGAFGLQDDIDNLFFIRKVLEEGSKNEDALANRFTDPRYKELSKAFGFGPTEFRMTGLSSFADDIVSRFEVGEFEVAAGDQDPSMRIALNSQRKIPDLAIEDISNDAKWFTIMGDPPMRQLFETALNLPKEFGQIDLDQQLKVLKEKSTKEFGTDDVSEFNNSKLLEDITTKYLVRDQIKSFNASYSSGSIALTLLQNL